MRHKFPAVACETVGIADGIDAEVRDLMFLQGWIRESDGKRMAASISFHRRLVAQSVSRHFGETNNQPRGCLTPAVQD